MPLSSPLCHVDPKFLLPRVKLIQTRRVATGKRRRSCLSEAMGRQASSSRTSLNYPSLARAACVISVVSAASLMLLLGSYTGTWSSCRLDCVLVWSRNRQWFIDVDSYLMFALETTYSTRQKTNTKYHKCIR